MGGLPTAKSVLAFASSDTTPRRFYVGSREGLFMTDSFSFSVQSAVSSAWRRLGEKLQDIGAIATHPGNPRLMYVATTSGALYRSDDTGLSWKQLR